MPLFKLSIDAASLETGRVVADALGEAATPSALAVTLFEAPGGFLVEAYYADEPLAGAVAAALPAGAVALPMRIAAVPEANWVALSQAALPPVRAGRLLVHGRHDRERAAGRRTALELEAGEAFGTGHNATTALCLEALDRAVRRRRFARVLDLGCGSGVLAIAAARLLPNAAVLAVDNDPVATAIARENARLNRVASSVRVLDAGGMAHAALRRPSVFDLVLANILPTPLIALAGDIRRGLAPGGTVVLSGLLDHQAREVRGRYLAADFRLVEQMSRQGWTALTLLRA